MEPELQRRIQRYGWDKAAEFYEDSWKQQLRPAQDKLMQMAELKPGEKVIETSCGTGLVTLRAARQVEPNGKVIATDLSDVMIKLAEKESTQRNINNVIFQQMDAEQIELGDHQFDAAICSLGLMYFPYPLEALKEMNRVLKPGGRVVVSVWGERKHCGWADIFPIVDKRVESDVCPMFFQQGTGNTLEFTMKKAEFTGLKTERLSVSICYSSEEEALMAAFAGGPVALAYRRFGDKIREEVHQDYLDSISQYREGEGFEIPGEFVVAKGIKD